MNPVSDMHEYERLFELSIDMLCILTLDGTLEKCNPAWHTTLGYELSELHAKSMFGFIHPEDLGMTSLELQRLCNEKKACTFENRFLCKDGSYRWLLWNAIPALERGRIYAVARDRTDRRYNEATMKESEGRYRSLVELSPDGIILQCDGKIIYANPAAIKLFPSTNPDEIIGASFLEIIPIENRNMIKERLDSVIETGKPIGPVHAVFHSPDGRIRYLEGTGIPITFMGKPAIQTIVRDITPFKLNEAKLQQYSERLKHLSQQLMNAQEVERRTVACELHDEIGQALTAAKINMDSLKRMGIAPQVAAQIDDTTCIIGHTLQLVRNLSLDLRPSILDDLGLIPALRWYINRQAERAGFTAQFSSVVFNERLPAELEITCFRVVQEAVTNIVRHAHAHRVSIELRNDQHKLHLMIQDDGKGFDVDAARKNAASGQSLGLLGMQERVLLVDGELNIQSEPGKGTTVLVYFPIGIDKSKSTIPKGESL